MEREGEGGERKEGEGRREQREMKERGGEEIVSSW